MDKQEFSEGHIEEALDRLHIVSTLIEDILMDHPGIVRAGQNDNIKQAAEWLVVAYQKLGNYEDK